MERQLIAYLMIALVVAGLAAIIAHNRYHSRRRTQRRQLQSEQEAYDRLMATRRAKAETP